MQLIINMINIIYISLLGSKIDLEAREEYLLGVNIPETNIGEI